MSQPTTRPPRIWRHTIGLSGSNFSHIADWHEQHIPWMAALLKQYPDAVDICVTDKDGAHNIYRLQEEAP